MTDERSDRLLGFDARESSFSAPWSPERRARFLLRRDVLQPVSVDALVWPSIAPSEGFTGPVERLWEDEAALRAAVRGPVVAFTAEAAFPLALEGQLDASSWELLGYDVADRWLYSGLMNCAYEADEAQRFAHALNAHHLFEHREVAADFREAVNVRVPEHAPFFVIGVWRNRST